MSPRMLPLPAAKNKYFERTETDLHKLGIKDANVAKYILLFQGVGLEGNCAQPCKEAVEAYQSEWIVKKESAPSDYAYCEHVDIVIDALETVWTYFAELKDIIDSEIIENNYVYTAGLDEYITRRDYIACPDYDTDTETKPFLKTAKKTVKKTAKKTAKKYYDCYTVCEIFDRVMLTFK